MMDDVIRPEGVSLLASKGCPHGIELGLRDLVRPVQQRLPDDRRNAVIVIAFVGLHDLVHQCALPTTLLPCDTPPAPDLPLVVVRAPPGIEAAIPA